MRPRHPLVLLGAWIAKHLITVSHVDIDIQAILEEEAAREAQAQARERSDRLGSLGSQADGSRLC